MMPIDAPQPRTAAATAASVKVRRDAKHARWIRELKQHGYTVIPPGAAT